MNRVDIPHKNEKLLIELTVKEAMALAGGVHFWEQPRFAAVARQKVRTSLEQRLIPGHDRLHYHTLEL